MTLPIEIRFFDNPLLSPAYQEAKVYRKVAALCKQGGWKGVLRNGGSWEEIGCFNGYIMGLLWGIPPGFHWVGYGGLGWVGSDPWPREVRRGIGDLGLMSWDIGYVPGEYEKFMGFIMLLYTAAFCSIKLARPGIWLAPEMRLQTSYSKPAKNQIIIR